MDGPRHPADEATPNIDTALLAAALLLALHQATRSALTMF